MTSGCVSAEYEAGVRFAARYVVQALTHVGREHALGADCVPYTGLLERAFGIAADRHRCGIAVSHAFHAGSGEVLDAGGHKRAVFLNDQYERVRSKVATRACGDDLFVDDLVHGFLIG